MKLYLFCIFIYLGLQTFVKEGMIMFGIVWIPKYETEMNDS